MRLYKYLHPDRVDVLQNLKIRFSSPAVLNDPFEMKPAIAALASQDEILHQFYESLPQSIAEEYSRLPVEIRAILTPELFASKIPEFLPSAEAAMLEMSGAVIPMLQNMMHDKFEELFGLLCLSESPESLLMWAHYADSHRGFLIEFDSEAPFFNQRLGPNDEFRHLRKVVYQQSRPSLILSKTDGIEVFLTKGSEWSYETEWRMLMPLPEASQIIGQGIYAIHLFAFPSTAIKGISFGCRMPANKKQEIRQLIRSSINLTHIKTREAMISKNEYRILFDDYQA